MIKGKSTLIKKTPIWYKLSRGTDSISIPAGVTNGRIKYMKMLGNTSSDTMRSVGDFDEATGKYAIKLHAHGKSFISGERFMELVTQSGASDTNKKETSGYFFTKPLEATNGTVIIDERHIKFKENTQYTIATTAKYSYSSSYRDLRLRFDYTDGSYYFPEVKKSQTQLQLCVCSEKDKTVRAISTHSTNTNGIRYLLSSFCIVEGAYDTYSEASAKYNGEWAQILLDNPLRSFGYTSDEIDLTKGIITRRVGRVTIGAGVSCAYTEDENIFLIMLPEAMRPSCSFSSPFPSIEAGEEYGITASADGRSILLKLPESALNDYDIVEYLTNNPFELIYPLKYPTTQKIDLPSILRTGDDSIVDVFTQLSPKKMISVYT